MMTPEENPEESFTDHSDPNHPSSEVCLICIFGEGIPGTLVFNDNTQASVEGAGGDGPDIGLSHSGVIEPEVSISNQVNLVSRHSAIAKLDVDRKVSDKGDGLSVTLSIPEHQWDGDQSTDVLFITVNSPSPKSTGCNSVVNLPPHVLEDG